MSNFWHGHTVEKDVLMFLSDYCKPNNVVFDVGAHYGWLTVPMSRLVGVNGKVVAFEPNPRNLENLVDNVVKNHCVNTHIVPAAVSDQTQTGVKFWDNLQNDLGTTGSLFEVESGSFLTVVDAISLDDFIEKEGIKPDIIKVDVEGAESLVVSGLSKYLKNTKPAIVLESSPSNRVAFDMLLKEGYRALDLHTYKKLKNDYLSNSLKAITNILFLHTDAKEFCKVNAFKRLKNEQLNNHFEYTDGCLYTKSPIKVEKGRLIVKLDFDYDEDSEVQIFIFSNGRVHAAIGGRASWLNRSYKEIVIDIQSGNEMIDICVFSPSNKDIKLNALELNLEKIEIYAWERHKEVDLVGLAIVTGDYTHAISAMELSIDQNRNPEIIYFFDRVLNGNTSTNGKLHYMAAVAHQRFGDYYNALLRYGRAEIAGGDKYWIYHQRGFLHKVMGNEVQAFEDFNLALKLNPLASEIIAELK